MIATLPDLTGNSTVAGLTARHGKNADAISTATTGTNTERGRYPGSKNGAGVWQVILNNIPPHDLWIEAFAGTAAVTRRKRPAAASIVIDADAAACCTLANTLNASLVSPQDGCKHRPPAGVSVVCADACRYIEGNRGAWNEQTCLYCDPPYPFSVRASKRRRYAHEFGDFEQHRNLLAVLSRVSCQGVKVLLSGYRNRLYDDVLRFFWRRVDYQTMTPGGPRTESLWCNFPEPTALHDYSAVGADYRQRQDLKRQRERWLARLAKMPPLKRAVLLGAIDEWRRTCPPGE